MTRHVGRIARAVLTASLASVLAISGGAECAEWSSQAAAVPANRKFQVPSPDRKRYLQVEGALLTVWEAGQVLPGSEGIDVLWSAELLWAPDSRAFSLTSRDSAEDGTWDVSVFILENDQVNYVSVTQEAVARFRERFPCMAKDDPNIGALKWLKDSKQLLLSIEIPAGGSCGSAGSHLGVVVNVPSGKITRIYEQGMLAEDWGETLGRHFTKRKP